MQGNRNIDRSSRRVLDPQGREVVAISQTSGVVCNGDIYDAVSGNNSSGGIFGKPWNVRTRFKIEFDIIKEEIGQINRYRFELDQMRIPIREVRNIHGNKAITKLTAGGVTTIRPPYFGIIDLERQVVAGSGIAAVFLLYIERQLRGAGK